MSEKNEMKTNKTPKNEIPFIRLMRLIQVELVGKKRGSSHPKLEKYFLGDSRKKGSGVSHRTLHKTFI